MKIRVLGSAAGGGFPQWNCNCSNCAGLRNGTLRSRPRTQSSIAIAGSGESSWALVNASPDVRAQLEANPVLQPGRGVRDTAIAAIILVDGQIDHTTGLYMLRESLRPWPLWCTDARTPISRVAIPCSACSRTIAASIGIALDSTARIPGRRRLECAMACDAGREQARAVFAEPHVADPGRQHRACGHRRRQRSDGALRAGTRRDRRRRLAQHAIRGLHPGGRHVLDG